jgi:mRNA interferase YafQ
MREIEPTTRFRRDYKREKKGRYAKDLDHWLAEVIETLATDQPLADRYRDHALTGDWSDLRDCHIKPDLVLIYRLVGMDTLQLVRLGSHSELGLA